MTEIGRKAQIDYNVQSIPSGASPNRDILTAAKGGGIVFFGRVFAYASRFIFGIIVARWVGANGFGLYSLGVTITEMLARMTLLGLPVGIVRFLPGAIRENDTERLWGILRTALVLVATLSVGLGVIVFILADWLATRLFHEPSLALVLRVGSICIPMIAVEQILMSATQAFNRMQYRVYADNIAYHTSRTGLSILFLGIGMGVAGVMTAHVIATFVAVILLFYFLDQLFPLRRPLPVARCNTRELMSFSLPLYLTYFINQFGGSFELMFLGALGTVTWVGVYNAALRIQSVGLLFLSAVQVAAMPVISDLHQRGQNAQLGQLYQTLTKWSLTFIMPFFLTVVMFSGPILSIFGSEFETGSLALAILALGTLVNAGTGICGTLLIMAGYSKLNLINSIALTVVTLALDLLLIPTWGIIGAAIATGVSVVAMNIIQTIQVYKLVKLWPYNRSFIKPVLAGVGAFLAILLVNRVAPSNTHLAYLALKISFLWLSYFAATILFGLSEEDQIVLGRVRHRFEAVLLRR
jgi:O-antigen/teichoic acid export membrane protein